MTRTLRTGATHVAHPFLFNFAATYSGGGYKRLHAFCRSFATQGGAWFALHPHCLPLTEEFPGNGYFIVTHSHLQRLFDDWSYLKRIGAHIGRPQLYYAYGIPLYRRFGQVNWSHLQNVLLFGQHAVPLSAARRLKFRLLSWRFRQGFRRADVISAESAYSIGVLAAAGWRDVFLSINGSDDELEALRKPTGQREPIATVVGTISYKALEDSYRTFKQLQQAHPGLKLVLIGEPAWIPDNLRSNPDVIVRGLLGRAAVIEYLHRSRFYISTTRVENSFNCAAEGAFLAAESYLSDIPPTQSDCAAATTPEPSCSIYN